MNTIYYYLIESIGVLWILQQTQSLPNHTSYRKFCFNEFVANVLCDNMGSKNSASNLRKKNEDVLLVLFGISASNIFSLVWKFSFQPQKCKLALCMSNGSKVLIYLSFLFLLHKVRGNCHFLDHLPLCPYII